MWASLTAAHGLSKLDLDNALWKDLFGSTPCLYHLVPRCVPLSSIGVASFGAFPTLSPRWSPYHLCLMP